MVADRPISTPQVPLALEPPASSPAPAPPVVSGLRKAAILLATLGDSETAGILRLLSMDQVQELTRQIGRLTRIAPAERTAVLAEFAEFIAQPDTTMGGTHLATSLLVAAFGATDGRRMAEQLFSAAASATPNLDRLRGTDPGTIASILQGEHPQLIAVLLSQLGTDAASSVLTRLPTDLKSSVALRIAALESVPPATAEHLASKLSSRLRVAADTETKPYGGTRSVAEIMNRIDPEESETILRQIDDEDPDLSRTIRSMMFVFEDLRSLREDALRAIISKVDKKLFTLALKGCSPQLKTHITGAISSRAAEMLAEDMQALGPVRIKDVEQAQQKVVEVVLQLKSEGVITLGAGQAEQFVD
jgi:flagellar motor switch protein FliG